MQKKIFLVLLSICFVLLFSGCQLVKIEKGELSPLTYTIVDKEEVPSEILRIIKEKKEKEIQFTYQNGEELYLVKGYGQQMSGGYSIAIEELGTCGKTVFFKTRLEGPSDMKLAGEPSYPYIVVKIPYHKGPVEFEG